MLLPKQKLDIKLVAVDLDGTLLSDESVVTADTLAAIAKLPQHGIQFVISTGRIRSRLPKAVLAIKDLRYAILSNGGNVLDMLTNETLAAFTFPIAKIQAILNIVRSAETYFEVYANDEAYTDELFYQYYSDTLYQPAKVADMAKSRHIVPSLTEFLQTANVTKAVIPRTSLTNKAKLVQEFEALGDIVITGSLPGNIELNYADCSKAKGLAILAQKLGIKESEVLVFGDESNDLEMLKYFTNSVAMGNAPATIKAAATYVTKTNNEDGIAYFLENFVF